MPIQDYIKRVPHGSPYKKLPFIIAMMDSDGNLQTMPFPPNYELNKGAIVKQEDTIYGIELIINPATLSSNLSKLIGRDKSMSSLVEYHWGEELDTLTFQGHTAAFVIGGSDIYSLKLSPETNATKNFLVATKGIPSFTGEGMGIHDTEVGLTVSQRRKSLSYIQFKRFLDIIRINGCMFDSFGLVSKRYYIYLSYGNTAYKGFFENVDVTEVGSDPFRYQFTVTFKSQETIYSYINRGNFNTPEIQPEPSTINNILLPTNLPEGNTNV